MPGKTDDQVRETNLATFFSYALRWNQVDMNVGLRYEHVSSNYLNLGKDVWDEDHSTSLPDLSRYQDYALAGSPLCKKLWKEYTYEENTGILMRYDGFALKKDWSYLQILWLG